MAQIDIPKIDELPEELDFWNTYREIYRSKDIDIARTYADVAESIKQDLRSPGGRDEFEELSSVGA
jgi:hypothetical protein